MNRLCPIGTLFIFVAVIDGCARKAPPPPTFAVTGEVRHTDGQPVAKGLVQFLPESGPSRNISAPIKDGKFTLVTSFGNEAAFRHYGGALSRNGYSGV